MRLLSLLYQFFFRVVLLSLLAVSALADDRKPVSLAVVDLSRSQDALLVNGTLVADRAATFRVCFRAGEQIARGYRRQG